MNYSRFIVFSLLIGCLAGCSVGPNYTPPYNEIPTTWKNEKDSCERCSDIVKEPEILDYWWQVFDDEKLEELEILALENNRDLFVAYERIEEARALMGVAAAEFYPQLTLNPAYNSTGELIKNYKSPNNPLAALFGDPIFRAHELLYFMPLNLSYEVDLWGQIKDRYDYAKFNWRAQQSDYEVVMLTLTANLATAYYQLRTADAQIDLLLKVIKTRQKAYEINKARFEGQLTFYGDVTVAAEEIDSALIQYQEALRQRDVLEDQIAVLIGFPASEFCLEALPLEGVPPCIPSGLPSDLLLRRPDIVEAELQARAEHALVKEAYTHYFPSLTLTTTGGFESPIFKDFMKWISRYWSLGGQANQLIFDGFRTPYTVREQIARFNEASGTYQQQVLIAFQEVEDALTDIDSYAKQYETALETVNWAQKSYQLYADRYSLGVIYYIDVANTERDLLNFQITSNALQGFRYLSTIQLIKALGGGWGTCLEQAKS